jgi:hypothetical protein
MEQQQTPKEAAQAGNYGHWRYHDQKGRWVPMPDPKKKGSNHGQ